MKELEVRREGVKDVTGDFIISLHRTLGHLATCRRRDNLSFTILFFRTKLIPRLPLNLLAFFVLSNTRDVLLPICSLPPVRRDETT